MSKKLMTLLFAMILGLTGVACDGDNEGRDGDGGLEIEGEIEGGEGEGEGGEGGED